MLKIADEVHVFEQDLKCLSDDGIWAGGLCHYIRNIQTGADIQTGSNVNSMKSFQGKVLFGEASGKLGTINEEGEAHTVSLHKNNICTIASHGDQILTGSWDNDAILLTPSSSNTDVCIDGVFYGKTEFPHPQAVWKVQFLDDRTFITACADKAIRIFRDGALKTTIWAHQHVVRGVCEADGYIYGIDNYGKLLKVTMEGQIVKSRNLNEMCFDMCMHNGLLVVCGDHGRVFVVNKDLQVLFGKRLPCATCWSLRTVDGRLYVTGSDGAIYIVEISEEIHHESEEAEVVEEKVPEPKKKAGDRTFVTEGVKYKIESGKIFMESEGGWVLLGDAECNYDHSFDVELGDKKYLLSFNDDESSHDIATKFINENKLDMTYHKEIVDYINSNFRRSTQFKRHESINIDGISKIIPGHPILGLLKDIVGGARYSVLMSADKNVYQIEDVLFDFKGIPLFVILDICKYLQFKKVWVDLAFLFGHEYQDKKEAKAFVFLMTNMVEDPPFSLARLDKKIKSLRDSGYLALNDVMSYDENCKISK